MQRDNSPLDQIKGKHILIDGDIVAYRCAASSERTLYLVESPEKIGAEFIDAENHRHAVELAGKNGIIWSRKEVQPLEFALQATKTCVDSLIAKLEPKGVSIYLSPERTFRHELARTKPYKGHRPSQKPKYLKQVEKYLEEQYGAKYGVNIEADDEIGMALSKLGTNGVSVSIDKDLLQVPGWHYNWVKDTISKVSNRDADFHFYTQMLTGDATDNIPGIAGIGSVGADKLLRGAKSKADLCSRVWNVYRGEFNDSQKARYYFFEQAQLLYILRSKNGFSCPIELK